jgi:hypothetical protein
MLQSRARRVLAVSQLAVPQRLTYVNSCDESEIAGGLRLAFAPRPDRRALHGAELSVILMRSKKYKQPMGAG